MEFIVLTYETEFLIKKIGARIKKARLRRNILFETLAEQVGISRGTLAAIERGDPSVTFGAYAAVLSALELVGDLEGVAIDREGRKKYGEAQVTKRK